MENHPIPQDVTGFKFRLIGSITVKQFLYLLGAGIFALIFYILPIPLYLKIPAMILPAIIGLALAFVPIDGRPMDKMIANFAKTIPAENQYIYHKKGVEMPYFYFTPLPQHVRGQQDITSIAADKAELFNTLSKSSFKPDEDEQKGLAQLSNLFTESARENKGVGSRLIHADAPVQEASLPASPINMAQIIQSQAQAAAAQQPQVVEQAIPTPPTAPATQPAQQIASQVNQTQPTAAAQEPSQFDAPNIIKGIVRDPRGKPLQHIIVEVLDSSNTAVRTFRTNQNGVFAAVTPMPNGFYTIHLDDTLKKQEFENVTFELTGSILPALEIRSTDQREKLRRELFGTTQQV